MAGNLTTAADDIRNHKFFEEIDFDELRSYNIESPFCPTVTSGVCYDSAHLSPVSAEEKAEISQKEFKNFEWSRCNNESD